MEQVKLWVLLSHLHVPLVHDLTKSRTQPTNSASTIHVLTDHLDHPCRHRSPFKWPQPMRKLSTSSSRQAIMIPRTSPIHIPSPPSSICTTRTLPSKRSPAHPFLWRARLHLSRRYSQCSRARSSAKTTSVDRVMGTRTLRHGNGACGVLGGLCDFGEGAA